MVNTSFLLVSYLVIYGGLAYAKCSWFRTPDISLSGLSLSHTVAHPSFQALSAILDMPAERTPWLATARAGLRGVTDPITVRPTLGDARSGMHTAAAVQHNCLQELEASKFLPQDMCLLPQNKHEFALPSPANRRKLIQFGVGLNFGLKLIHVLDEKLSTDIEGANDEVLDKDVQKYTICIDVSQNVRSCSPL